MKVAEKDESLRYSGKAASSALRRIGMAVERPEVFALVQVQPGFDVAEVAVFNLPAWLERRQEIEDRRRIDGVSRLRRVAAEGEVVISPDHLCSGPHEHIGDLRAARLANEGVVDISQDDD